MTTVVKVEAGVGKEAIQDLLKEFPTQAREFLFELGEFMKQHCKAEVDDDKLPSGVAITLMCVIQGYTVGQMCKGEDDEDLSALSLVAGLSSIIADNAAMSLKFDERTTIN